MKSLHYYIKHQSQQLRQEMDAISALLAELSKQHHHHAYYREIKTYLINFNIRKQIELLNFNKQLNNKHFKFNVTEEHKRIKNDLIQLKKIQNQIGNLTELNELIESLENHQKHYTIPGISSKIFKKLGMVGEGWEGARGLISVNSQILNFVSVAISGIFDVISLTKETISSFFMRKRALEKYETGKEVYQHKQGINKNQLSDKAKQYEKKNTKSNALLKKKSELHLERAVIGAINGAVGLVGSTVSLAAIGIGVVSLLEFYNAISVSFAVMSILSVTTTYLSIFGPTALAIIYANKFNLATKEQALKEKCVAEAKNEFKQALHNLNDDKKIYHILKTNHYSYDSNIIRDSKYRKVYEKELNYRKEKSALKSIGLTKIFSGITLLASTLAAFGATLLCLSLLGFVSAGSLPAALLISGSVLAVGFAIFEHVDKKNNRKYTNWIANKWKQFKHYLEDKPEPKKTNQQKLKETIEVSASEVLSNREPNFSHYNHIYEQLHGSERKLFRKSALEQVQNTANSISDVSETVSYLTTARNNSVFNKPRHLFGFFKNTKAINKIDAAIEYKTKHRYQY